MNYIFLYSKKFNRASQKNEPCSEFGGMNFNSLKSDDWSNSIIKPYEPAIQSGQPNQAAA